jgi:hypothetical protein
MFSRMRRAVSVLFIALFAWSAAVRADDAAPVVLTSPSDFQVFQRQTRVSGQVLIAGTASSAARVEYRWRGGAPLEGELVGKWRAIERLREGGGFRAEVETPAGGWYELEVRAVVGDREAGSVKVEHVGVGEVFIVAGQSNATNYGAEKQKPASGHVVAFDGKSWRIADDPQPGTHDRSKGGGSFVPAFGDALYARLKVPIAVACVGQGSSSVRQWLPKGELIEKRPTIDKFIVAAEGGKWRASGELFEHLMGRVEALLPPPPSPRGGFRAILWHQGESDAGQARSGYPAEWQISGKEYTAYLETIIRASRRRAGWEAPWFVAKATYHSEADPSDAEFRAAQQAVCDDGVALAGPDTDVLGKRYRAGVHFNGEGLREHGRLWAESVGAWVEKREDEGTR